MPPAARPAHPFARTLCLVFLALLLCAVTTAAAASFATADAPTYSAHGATAATENWTYRGAGHPKPCSAWVQANGTVRARVTAKGGFRLQRIPGYGVLGGMTNRGPAMMNVSRTIDYKIHRVGTTPDCTSCGPLSEYGPCGAAIPDENGHKGCAPAASEGGFVVTVTRGTLVATGTAASAEILRRCSALIPQGVPLGSPEPQLPPARFAGAARRIARLRPGASATFKRTIERGSGCKQRKGGEMRSCTRHETVVVVDRIH